MTVTEWTILHARPSDPRRMAIVAYADHFRLALEAIACALAVRDHSPERAAAAVEEIYRNENNSG